MDCKAEGDWNSFLKISVVLNKTNANVQETTKKTRDLKSYI